MSVKKKYIYTYYYGVLVILTERKNENLNLKLLCFHSIGIFLSEKVLDKWYIYMETL